MKKNIRVISAALFAAMMISMLFAGTSFADNSGSFYPGKIVVFGSYEQDNDLSNGSEPLEWIALERNGNEMLMISRYAVDCRPFHEVSARIRWADSSLRYWLNNEFYNLAFSSSEQQQILISDVDKVDAGEETEDAIYLLSISEAYEYWDYLKNFEYTDYAEAMAKAQGEKVYNQNEGYWWLLSHGNKGAKFTDRKACAWREGVQPYGHGVEHVNGGVRPALRVKLAS